VNELLALLPTRVEYACLFLTRVLALVATAPVFGTAIPWNGHRLALGVALAAVLLPAVGDPSWSGPSFGLALVPLVVRELIVGTFLGFIVVGAFAAVRAAGELIGNEMGLNLASILDPTTGAPTAVAGMLYQVCAGLLFLAVGAHRWVIAGLARSFERVPVGAFELGADPVAGVVTLARGLVEGGLVLAAPVMVALFLVTVSLGVLSRAVPQLNILDVGYALRVAAALGAIALLMPALRVGIESLLRATRDSLVDALPSIAR
jgi:flagellar biosynthesis protein FliR